MALVGGADEIVIVDVHQLPQILDARNDMVDIFLRGHALVAGLALDLLAVLIGAGEEMHVVAGELLEAGHGISRRGAVGVTDVQVVAGIVDGGCDVEGLFAFLTHARGSSFFPDGQSKRPVPFSIGADLSTIRVATLIFHSSYA